MIAASGAMMKGQQALVVNLHDATHRVVPLDVHPHLIDVLQVCLEPQLLGQHTGPDGIAATPAFVVGNGPFGGSAMPGANQLVLATMSPLYGGYYLTTLAGLGLAFDAMGCAPLVLRGRTRKPSALIIHRRRDRLMVQLESCDPLLLWHARPSDENLLRIFFEQLGSRYAIDLASAIALAVGPAAATTRYGALAGAVWNAEQQAFAPLEVTRRAGMGSLLWQRHGVSAVVIGSDRFSEQLMQRGLVSGRFAGRFTPDSTLDELERAVAVSFDQRLVHGGTALRRWLSDGAATLACNARSIYLGADQRLDFHQRVMSPLLLAQMTEALAADHTGRDCGAPCPVSCKKRVEGPLLELEPCSQLGPQLGIFELESLQRVLVQAERLAFDVTTLGGLLGWLMERLYLELLTPREVGLEERPRWDFDTFRGVEDSRHNAEIACALIHGIWSAPWARSLREGFGAALHETTDDSREQALLLPHGRGGEVVPQGVWTVGTVAPSPWPGEAFGDQTRCFVEPRALGARMADRVVLQLAQLNWGLCELHRGWTERLVPQLIRLYGEPPTLWYERHHAAARTCYNVGRPRPWTSQRVRDWVERALLAQQRDGAPSRELDDWVERFDHDGQTAARAFWSELDAGLAGGLR